ncbi:type II toxin-antitoxin system RelE/ParE family toxin [Candidatus Poriferisodalis sp.]|uniref:type II toxin-antitoxin system RelE/ParE family toxin n=1 Tax=Candidatus Poriferisodalis sp. TaxID=3101277 RepID=UPI003AF9CE94
MWEVEYADEFEHWWLGLTEAQQEALDDRVMLLAEVGPGLKRPVVGEIKASRHANMKELRASRGGALRVLFAFDPRRHAILLLGGDKSGLWKDWYRTAIPAADDLYDRHLTALAEQGPIDDDS